MTIQGINGPQQAAINNLLRQGYVIASTGAAVRMTRGASRVAVLWTGEVRRG